MLVRRGGIEIICNQQRFDNELKAQGYQIVVKPEEKPAELPYIEEPAPEVPEVVKPKRNTRKK